MSGAGCDRIQQAGVGLVKRHGSFAFVKHRNVLAIERGEEPLASLGGVTNLVALLGKSRKRLLDEITGILRFARQGQAEPVQIGIIPVGNELEPVPVHFVVGEDEPSVYSVEFYSTEPARMREQQVPCNQTASVLFWKGLPTRPLRRSKHLMKSSKTPFATSTMGPALDKASANEYEPVGKMAGRRHASD